MKPACVVIAERISGAQCETCRNLAMPCHVIALRMYCAACCPACKEAGERKGK
jgi:hypothetical protein